jgi:hypothetical protein
MVGPRMIVPPAGFTPIPYGLMSVVESRTSPSPHWQAGVLWEDFCGPPLTTYDLCWVDNEAITGAPPAKTPGAEHENFAATPFTIYSRVDCSTPGFYDQSENTAATVLTEWEQWQIENVFWTGTVAGVANVAYPHLAANTDVISAVDNATLQIAANVPQATPTDPATALGIVENALADCYPGVGIVHIPVELIPRFVEAYLIYRDGQRLRTYNGNYVAAGAGYPNTSPAGATVPLTGGGWIYATPPVFMYRSPLRTISARETLDRTVNTVEALSERTVLLGYSCCLAAAPVAIPA